MTREVTRRWEDFARAKRFEEGSPVWVGSHAKKHYIRVVGGAQVGFAVTDQDAF